MNIVEKLENEACENEVEIIDYSFDSPQIKGLYLNGVIGISRQLDTIKEKSCILAEELGHHYTTVGDILDQSDVNNRKQEQRARLWAYNKMVGLMGIVNAYNHHCQSLSECAEYLGVSEGFLQETLLRYKSKYGRCTTVDNYVIFFEPYISVLELKET